MTHWAWPECRDAFGWDLDLLDSAGLVAELQKYAGDAARRRRSTPKLVAHNTALVSAVMGREFARTRSDPAA